MRSISLAAGLALIACGCTAQQPPGGAAGSPGPAASPRPSASPTAVPIHIVTRGGDGQYVRIVETIRGRKVYTIRALSGNMQRSGTSEATGELEQPHVTFVDKSGATTIADAPKAHVSERNKTVVMTGGVRAQTSTGSVLRCDTLIYHGSTERFHGDGHVVLTAHNGSLAGEHLDGDVRLQDVSVTGNPR
jgi:LPS export ABC transporter protein LptC